MGYTSSAINSSAWATYDMTVVLGLGTIIPINNTFYVYIKSAHTNPTEVHTLFQFVPVHESKARKRKERAEAFCGVSHTYGLRLAAAAATRTARTAADDGAGEFVHWM